MLMLPNNAAMQLHCTNDISMLPHDSLPHRYSLPCISIQLSSIDDTGQALNCSSQSSNEQHIVIYTAEMVHA